MTTNFVPDTFAQIEAASPSLPLIDLAVGEHAGWDLLADLRQGTTTHQIAIILLRTTSSLIDRAKEEQAAFGGARYLVKPFNLDDLIPMVQGFRALPGRRRQPRPIFRR